MSSDNRKDFECQFVILRKRDLEDGTLHTIPCWVPVHEVCINPEKAYKHYQKVCDDFLIEYADESEEFKQKSFAKLVNNWLDPEFGDLSLNCMHEILSFAKTMDAESIVITPTFFNLNDQIEFGSFGTITITFAKEEGDESA